MSVYELCEQAIGLVRGKRLILTTSERTLLEALNYEGLTGAHAQEEAVVCALHFARVRDRLFELYAWRFARKVATVAGGADLPADCATVLCVCVNGRPVDYVQTGAKLNVDVSAEVHYTARITDTSQWCGLFRDVFAYSLAEEICTAVTGRPEYTQVLEAKIQELIRRAYQTGAIQPETRLTEKEELYRRAIVLSRGIRSVSGSGNAASGQGLDVLGVPDWRTNAEMSACEAGAPVVRDRLLEGYAWTFARKSAVLSRITGTVAGWSYGYSLPSDCLTVQGVLGGNEAVEYERVGDKVYCNADSATARYTARVEAVSSWSGAFKDAFTYQLASEIVCATTGNAEVMKLLDEKARLVVSEAMQGGEIQDEGLVSLDEELYNRAINLARGTAGEGEISSQRRAREIAVCRAGSGSIRDRLFQLYAWEFARKNAELNSVVTAIGGWKYGYEVPPDCMKVLALVKDGAVAEYEESGGRVYCNVSAPSLRYTARIAEMSLWPGNFADVFVYSLAQEIVLATTRQATILQLLEQKVQLLLRDAVRIGAIRAEYRMPVAEELYNRAIALLKGSRTVDPLSGKSAEEGADITGDASSRIREEVAVCRRSGDGVRDKLLELYAWEFAKATASGVSTTLSSGWENAYNKPADCMKVLNVLVNGEPVEYEVSDGKVLCNGAGASIRYVRKVEDVNEWPSVFREVYCYYLAVEVGLAVGAGIQVIQLLREQALMILEESRKSGAISSDANVSVKDEVCARSVSLSGVKGHKGEDGKAEFLTEAQRVSRRSYSAVVERVLQMYPWRFARKSAVVNAGAALPSDCVAVLSVLVDGKPCDWEIVSGKLKCSGNAEVQYTARITDSAKWEALFREVMCYMLAEEIVTSTTGDGTVYQMLEQKVQELIRNGYRLGVIQEVTQLTPEREIYRRAINLVHGQKTEPDVYGELNDRREAEIRACELSYGTLRDKLLEGYAWTFARKSAGLTVGYPAISGWSYYHELPEDCLCVLSVMSVDDAQAVEWEVSDGKLYTVEEGVTVRYTARKTDAGEYPAGFTDALVYLLANEVLNATQTANEGTMKASEMFLSRSQMSVEESRRMGLIRRDFPRPLNEELYNRAISLVKGQRRVSPSEQGTDITGDADYYEREALNVCRRSLPELRDKLLKAYAWKAARKTATLTAGVKVSGWSNAYKVPEDCMRVLSVLCGDEPVEYEEADGQILTDASGAMTARYTRSVTEVSELDAVFREVLCYEMASEISAVLGWNAEQLSVYEQKKQLLIQNAIRTGVIEEEVLIPIKEELSRRAVMLSYGVRNTQELEGVNDTRYVEAVRSAKNSYDMIRDKTAQLYPWVFARKSAELSGGSGVSGWAYGYVLPSDCLTVLCVLSNGEAEDFETVGGYVYSNGSKAVIRYTSRMENIQEWPGVFSDAFVYALAVEISASVSGAREIIPVLEQKLSGLIQDGYKIGAIKTETRIPAKHELYNRAIGLVKGLKTGSPDVLDTRYEDEITACRLNFTGVRDRLLQMYAWVFAAVQRPLQDCLRECLGGVIRMCCRLNA